MSKLLDVMICSRSTGMSSSTRVVLTISFKSVFKVSNNHCFYQLVKKMKETSKFALRYIPIFNILHHLGVNLDILSVVMLDYIEALPQLPVHPRLFKQLKPNQHDYVDYNYFPYGDRINQFINLVCKKIRSTYVKIARKDLSVYYIGIDRNVLSYFDCYSNSVSSIKDISNSLNLDVPKIIKNYELRFSRSNEVTRLVLLKMIFHYRPIRLTYKKTRHMFQTMFRFTLHHKTGKLHLSISDGGLLLYNILQSVCMMANPKFIKKKPSTREKRTDWIISTYSPYFAKRDVTYKENRLRYDLFYLDMSEYIGAPIILPKILLESYVSGRIIDTFVIHHCVLARVFMYANTPSDNYDEDYAETLF